MAQVLVEQAVFSSDNNDRVRGYQIIARSPGVTRDIARELVRWSPSHQAILSAELNAQCVMCFPVSDRCVAIGRTVYGLPEYSGRGGRETSTRWLVTTREHLEGFANNAWNLWQAARSQGYLQWSAGDPEVLPALPLIAQWGLANAPLTRRYSVEFVESSARLLNDGRRVAVIGAGECEEILAGVLARLPEARCGEISFGTGLRPSVARPFDLQVLPEVDRDVCAELSADRVALVGR